MNKRKILFISLLGIFIIGGCTIHKIETSDSKEDIYENEKTSDSIKVTIEGKTYKATLENNETAEIFIDLLPRSFHMSELNENEKYVYLDNRLPVDAYTPEYITAGDIMLYGNNCLVIFYQSFVSSDSYTKIGHIDNIEDLGSEDVIVKFEK